LSIATRWVRARGKAMQEAVPQGEGGMTALLGLEDAQVQVLCAEATEKAKSTTGEDEFAEPANYNAPGQVVIAGTTAALEACETILKSKEIKGAKAIPLPVSAPFHSRLMQPARQAMADLFSQLAEEDKPRPLQCPYVPNDVARVVSEHALILDHLIEQIDHPVLWKQTIELFCQRGLETAVEFGPGKVLAGLNKRIARNIGKKFQTFSLGAIEDVASLEGLLK